MKGGNIRICFRAPISPLRIYISCSHRPHRLPLHLMAIQAIQSGALLLHYVDGSFFPRFSFIDRYDACGYQIFLKSVSLPNRARLLFYSFLAKKTERGVKGSHKGQRNIFGGLGNTGSSSWDTRRLGGLFPELEGYCLLVFGGVGRRCVYTFCLDLDPFILIVWAKW